LREGDFERRRKLGRRWEGVGCDAGELKRHRERELQLG